MQIVIFIFVAYIAALIARAKSSTAVALPTNEMNRRADFERMLYVQKYSPRSRYSHLLASAASRYEVPLPLLDAIIHVESSDGVNVTGLAGEIGVMQILPSTAEEIKAYYAEFRWQDVHNVSTNIAMAAAYLRLLYQDQGNWAKAAIRYNSVRVNEENHPYFLKLYGFLTSRGL